MEKVRGSVKDLLPESKEQFSARTKLPNDVKDRVDRAVARTREDAPTRNRCWEFWRGQHFAYLNEKGLLKFLSSGAAGIRLPGKPSWRSRLSTNLFRDNCEQQVSLATQRVPSYDVVPAKTDAEVIAAARLARKAAVYGHEKWDISAVTDNTVRHAVVGDEGFAWPFWDSSVGPFIDTGDGHVGMGEVNIRVFGANQVGWEPGLSFEQSPFHYVEYAASAESLMEAPGFLGGELVEDADTDQSKGQKKASKTKLVLVREYLERPSQKHPQGRWLTIANDRIIHGKTDEDTWRPYPCAEYGYEGIVLHRLSYYPDSDSDRGQGLGRDLIDPMQLFDDCMNRLVEWKNVLLVPRGFVQPGLFQKQKFTGAPGEFLEVPQPNENVKLMDAPEAPRTLFELADKAADLMAKLSAQSDPPAGVESGKAFQVWDERQKLRGYSFYVRLAKWYAGLMMHCLYLVQKHYTEQRLLTLRGTAGWESIEGFRGVDLNGQLDVRVMPDSVEPMTRQAAEQRIMFYAQQGWISPERAMQAIEYGTADKLIEDVQHDYERANRVIQAIKKGPEVLFAMKGRRIGVEPPVNVDGTPNPLAGRPMYEPGWLPRPFDNLPVQKYVFETWMKSFDFDMLTDDMKESAWHVYDALLKLEAEQMAQRAMAQTLVAESKGMQNAAKDPGPKSPPDEPAVPGGNPGPTRNQPPGQGIPTPV